MAASTPSGTEKRFHYGYVIVFCCCLIMAVNAGIAMACAGVFYKPVSADLGVSVGEFGLYMSFNFLASSLMLSVAGRMMVRYGARRLLSLSSGVMGLSLLAMGCFNAVWQFYAAGAIIGITLAFLYFLSFPTLINSWFRSRVGLYMGICSAAMGLGGAVFNPICVQLISSCGWRGTYWILGGTMLLVVTPLLALLLRNAPATPPADHPVATPTRQAAPSGPDYAQALRMPVLYALIAYAFLINATAPLYLIMPSYISGLSTAEQGGLVAAAVMLGVTVGKIALGIINDKSYTLGVCVSTLSGIVGLVVLSVGPLWSFVPGGFLFGWAFAGVSVQTPLLVRAVFGSRSYTLINSRVSIALAVGGAVAGGWGLLADATSYRFTFVLGALFLATCLAIGLRVLQARHAVSVQD